MQSNPRHFLRNAGTAGTYPPYCSSPLCAFPLRRWNAVCVFDDAVEHCGEGAHKYLPACFPAFLDGMTEVHTTQISRKCQIVSTHLAPKTTCPLCTSLACRTLNVTHSRCILVEHEYFRCLLHMKQASHPSCWISRSCRSNRRRPEFERNNCHIPYVLNATLKYPDM